MSDQRHKNVEWQLGDPIPTWERVEVAVLMDIRDALQAINNKLTGVGPTVHKIERNTRKITCHKCRRGPFLSYRGLHQHARLAHA
jgi:hypothetical protein